MKINKGRKMDNKLWLRAFGDDYVDRNPVTEEQISSRCIYFSNILNVIKNDGRGDFPAEILEVGAGQGINLVALERIIHAADLKIKLYALEPNEKAREILKKSVNNVNVYETKDMLPTLDIGSHSKELVFTMGVLIHVPSDILIPSVRELYRISSRYILCAEYFSPVERKIPYHGHDDALWLRDYGGVYMDNFKLKLLGWGFCWKRITKMDDLTWFLFEKVN